MGKFRRKDTAPAQQDLWLRPEEIVTGPHNLFYTKLAVLLEKVRFTETVHRICAPHYRLESSAGGRPPVDPAVLMRMLIVGFLEGIGSERGIASRCADSLAIRRFLGYSLMEETPDHSTFTVFRRRLPVDAFEALHAEVLRSLLPLCQDSCPGCAVVIPDGVAAAAADLLKPMKPIPPERREAILTRLSGPAREPVARVAAQEGISPATPCL